MKVTLLGHTSKPLYTICTAIATMKEGDPLKIMYDLPIDKGEKMIEELMKTRLIGALEFASFEFLIEDVTRAFTHQLVRHRTMHFSQQSLRFFNASSSGFRYPQTKDHLQKIAIESTVDTIMESYRMLIGLHVPTEDARSILPTNILTKIAFGATFRGLLEMAEVRLCLQTQAEFREFMQAIKDEVTKVDIFLGSLLIPACVRSKRCEFKSIYDRPCSLNPEKKEVTE